MNLINFKETVEYLGITNYHLRSLIFKEKIPTIRVGRLVKFNKDELNNWLISNSKNSVNFIKDINSVVNSEKVVKNQFEKHKDHNVFESENIEIKKSNNLLFNRVQKLSKDNDFLSKELLRVNQENEINSKLLKKLEKFHNEAKTYISDLERKYLMYRDQELRRIKKELD